MMAMIDCIGRQNLTATCCLVSKKELCQIALLPNLVKCHATVSEKNFEVNPWSSSFWSKSVIMMMTLTWMQMQHTPLLKKSPTSHADRALYAWVVHLADAFITISVCLCVWICELSVTDGALSIPWNLHSYITILENKPPLLFLAKSLSEIN